MHFWSTHREHISYSWPPLSPFSVPTSCLSSADHTEKYGEGLQNYSSFRTNNCCSFLPQLIHITIRVWKSNWTKIWTHFSLLIDSLCLWFSVKGLGSKRNDKHTKYCKKRVQQFPLILGTLEARRNSSVWVSQGQIPTWESKLGCVTDTDRWVSRALNNLMELLANLHTGCRWVKWGCVKDIKQAKTKV